MSGKITKLEDIQVWQNARILVKETYSITKLFNNDFALKDQMRRCAISIMANIAEGYGRKSFSEFAQFLNISHGSVAELQSHLYIALDLDYIRKEKFDELYNQSDIISKMLLNFQKYLRNNKK